MTVVTFDEEWAEDGGNTGCLLDCWAPGDAVVNGYAGILQDLYVFDVLPVQPESWF